MLDDINKVIKEHLPEHVSEMLQNQLAKIPKLEKEINDLEFSYGESQEEEKRLLSRLHKAEAEVENLKTQVQRKANLDS